MKSQSYRPTTPARRGMTRRGDNTLITKKKPVKSLTAKKRKITGRSNQGKITIRHRGGGAKRLYRLVDFKNIDSEVKVVAIEYDPNRNAHVALVSDENAKQYYILAGNKMKVGQSLKTGAKTAIKQGNRTQLKSIPLGTSVYNVEMIAGKGGQIARSAGASVKVSAKGRKYAHLRLPSGEMRRIPLNAYATIGSVGNESIARTKFGSAGRRRRLGFRPSVRGKAMNPVDHPMGGGEGQSSPGRLPRTPWGKIAIGKKTRANKKTQKYIIRSRQQSRRK